MERHTFNLRQQEDGESFDDFMTDVKTLSKNCKFCDTCYNGLLRDRLVGGIASNSTKKKLLSEKDLTLEKTIDICRASEKAVEGMQLLSKKKSDVEDNGEEISWVNKNVRGGGSYSNSKTRNLQQRSGKRDFASCKFCRTCGLLNHFAGSSVCQNQVTKLKDTNSGIGALFLGSLEDKVESKKGIASEINYINHRNQNAWEIELPTQQGSIKFKIDTGAEVIRLRHLSQAGVSKSEIKTKFGQMGATLKASVLCYIRNMGINGN